MQDSMSATAEKTGFEAMSRGMAREAGAPLRGPRCGQQRRCTGAECGSSAAVRRAIVCFSDAPFTCRGPAQGDGLAQMEMLNPNWEWCGPPQSHTLVVIECGVSPPAGGTGRHLLVCLVPPPKGGGVSWCGDLASEHVLGKWSDTPLCFGGKTSFL